MPKMREAGAGRGFINPKPVNMPEEEYVSPKEHYDMRKQQMEEAESAATERAYKKASGMRKGGYVKAADGCATRGKTKGKMISMV